MVELDDCQGHCPWHNQSAHKVRREVGKLFATRGKGVGMSGLLTTPGNKMRVATTMGPRGLFKSLR